MLFSVIIPAYNRLAYLPQTLESVWAQRFSDHELIVVDDGSTDGSLAYLESLGARIRLISQNNQGPGAARNAGAEAAHGEYLAFLDSDDLWFPWTLSVFAALIEKHGSPVILSANLREFGDEAELAAVREAEPAADAFPDYLTASHTGYYTGSGMAVYRRERFLAVGGFTTRRINAEDHDFTLRMGLEPGFVQVLEPVTGGWRRHPDAATKNYRAGLDGILYLLEQERQGAYPGGAARARQRREIISRHARPVALECLKRECRRGAWTIYRETLSWHIVGRRWKFLLGFPAKAIAASLQGSQR